MAEPASPAGNQAAGNQAAGNQPGVSQPADKPVRQWLLAGGLFAVVCFTATTMGVDWVLAARTDVVSPIPQVPYAGAMLTPAVVRMVWSDPALLRVGLMFSLPVMLILLCHELGHYVFCRRYRIDSTPPFFLPAPAAIGTFGAFIRIRAPIRDKRQLFDVGIAGPIGGFVVLLPFLVYGIARSVPTAIALAAPNQSALMLQLPGPSLLTLLVRWLVHGPLPPNTVLNPHPFVLAAWVGLFATSLNLLPLSQLDGGHILYAVLGRRQWKLALPLWLLLVAAGFLFPGWWLWALIVMLIGLRHPPVADEEMPLGRGRIALAVVALAMLVLCFMPVPLVWLPTRP
ncbi:MAG TPA: site-2 protease family protein [Thermoanaerobaculia bacterium]|jgi:membrane-associated protease RseP (regulator of RpoE activity)|nr:site-2 protease family protein [Thermoanaerobaculia bacterium]